MREEFAKAALLGTDYYQFDVKAQSLLHHFGIQALQSRAGFVAPKTNNTPIKSARADTMPMSNARTWRQFANLAASRHHAILTIWMRKFAEQGLRLPDEFIPPLLNKKTVTKLEIRSLFGEKLNWYLDVSNHSWTEAEKMDLEEDSLPYVIRRYMADKSNDWLVEKWDKLTVAEQQFYLQMMQTNLAQEHVPFLMKVYEDNENEKTRFYATYLLSLIAPELVQELINKVLDSVHFVYLNSEIPVLDVCWSELFSEFALKQNCDDFLRDFLIESSVLSIQEYLSIIPIETWFAHLGTNPDDLLQGAFNGKNTNLFFSAWQKRIIDEKHSAFAWSMLSVSAKRVSINTKNLLEIIPFAYLQDYVDEKLQHI